MGKSLKSIDILGGLEKASEASLTGPEQEVVPTSKVAIGRAGGKAAERRLRRTELTDTAPGKPSPYESDLRHKLRDKVQLNFASVPRFVRKEFERLAEEADMNMREYLYHLLREKGADIPPYEHMDGRKL